MVYQTQRNCCRITFHPLILTSLILFLSLLIYFTKKDLSWLFILHVWNEKAIIIIVFWQLTVYYAMFNFFFFRAKHPTKVYVWAGISKRVRTGICIFEAMINSQLWNPYSRTHTVTVGRNSLSRWPSSYGWQWPEAHIEGSSRISSRKWSVLVEYSCRVTWLQSYQEPLAWGKKVH